MHPHALDVFSRLDAARAALGAAVDRVPPALRQQRPGPDRWSAAEVIEHISIVERLFGGRVTEAIGAARSTGLAAEAGDDRLPLPDAIETRMADRMNKRTAVEAAQPTGSLDAVAAWAALEAGHERLRQTVAGAEGLALGQVTLAHPFFGEMSVYQFVELMAAHEMRHAEQITEIANALRTGAASTD
jgi:uncharacterized damage-inducible protein DinB